jgi:hypothetical protein
MSIFADLGFGGFLTVLSPKISLSSVAFLGDSVGSAGLRCRGVAGLVEYGGAATARIVGV